LADVIVINRAFFQAVESITPAFLTACHWNTLVVFINAVVCAANERNIAF